VSSDTPRVVCLHVFADSGPPQAPDQARYPPETPNMPTNCGSPAWAMTVAPGSPSVPARGQECRPRACHPAGLTTCVSSSCH